MILVYKQFILKIKDIDILYGDYELTILETYNMSPSLYPIALKNDDPEALLEWLKQGNIQKNRTGGYEPYAEYYAYKVAEQMGLNVVAYDLDMWHCQLASV